MTPFRRFTLALAAVMAVVLLVAACGDSDSTPVPAPSPTPTQPPDGPTPTPTPPDDPTQTPVPARFIYMYDVREKDSAGRLWPTRAIVVYDLETKQEISRFEFGGVGEYPVNAIVSGDYIITATEPRVVRTALDGSGELVLFEVPGGTAVDLSTLFVAGIALSPDGSTLALTVYTLGQCSEPCDGLEDGTVIFIDVATGNEINRVRKVDAFPGYTGWPAYPRWTADGSSVIVTASTHSEAPGSTVTVRLDGTATIHPQRGGTISPDGKMVAVGDGSWVACFDSAKLRIATVADDQTVQEVDGNGMGLVWWGWSPGGKTLLYQAITWADPSKACDQEPISRELRLLDITTGETRAAGDLAALQREWYGDDAVTITCPAGALVEGLPWNQRLGCYDPAQFEPVEGIVTVRGVQVGEFAQLSVLGVLDGSPTE